MSISSSLAQKIGLSDIDPLFLKLYSTGFELQSSFDVNSDRRNLLKNIQNYTHVNYGRLKFLYDLSEQVGDSKIEGAFVETGVWRGGSAGILACMSKKYNYKHPLFFFDSFEGLPEPTQEDGEDAEIFSNNQTSGNLVPIEKLKAEETYIQELLFEKLSIDPTKVNIVKGWFQDTLPVNKDKIEKIAILRLDGDWYESTKVALENLYDLVVSGGYIVIDDYYFWDGCKKAVNDFVSEKDLKININGNVASGAYIVKP